jgi:membrane associated rhomboid family serine protease
MCSKKLCVSPHPGPIRRLYQPMLPLKDTVQARSLPFVTIALIGANALVFLIELRLPPALLADFLWLLGVVPARLLSAPLPGEWLTLITAQFLHSDWLHILSNLLALYIFGDNVEDRLGHARFLVFYLLCGTISELVHTWFNYTSFIPAIGASGAISGILAAYLVLFPTARIVTLIPLFFIPWFIEVPAVFWIGGWFLSQLLSGLLAISEGAEALGGIAWWAHIGGFIAGLILVWPLRRPAPRFYPDEYWPW